MQMKVFIVCCVLGFFIFSTTPAVAYSIDYQETARQDTVAKKKLDYENVTVSVVTDWGVSDKHANVDVQLIWEGKKVKEIVVYKEHSTCNVTLMEGVVVTISDSKTGKVLKTFK